MIVPLKQIPDSINIDIDNLAEIDVSTRERRKKNGNP